MLLVETLAILFALLILAKSAVFIIAPGKAKKLYKQYMKNKRFSGLYIIAGIAVIYQSAQDLPVSNVLATLLGFSLIVGGMMQRYTKSMEVMIDEAMSDRSMKPLSIIGILVGLYLLHILL